MPSLSENELRRLVAEGLRGVNSYHGGRYMSRVARELGVDRTTVGRWLRSETTASVDHCRTLASYYPTFFSEQRLVELHAHAATGLRSAEELLTVGATVHPTTADVYRAVTRSLRSDPGASNEVSLHVAFHLDHRGTDAVEDDPHLDSDTSTQILEFRTAMQERAVQGWKMRTVVVANNALRYNTIENMVQSLDGPDVEIRAYAMSIPLAVAPLIIANRDVFLAYDHRRWERPGSALELRSSPIVGWATSYFDQLFLDASYTLRNIHGPVASELDRFQRALRRDPQEAPPQ